MNEQMKDIIEFLKLNNAPTEYLNKLESLKPVNLDSVKEFLEKDEVGKKFLQAQKDAAVTKGIETYKEKTMPGLIEEEIKKRFPDETPEQKRMRELETKQQKLEAEIKRKDLLNKAISYATQKKLPIKFVDKFLGDDEESTIKNINSFGDIYNEAIATAVNEIFKDNGRNVGGAGGNNGQGKDLSKMTDEEYYNYRLSQKKQT